MQIIQDKNIVEGGKGSNINAKYLLGKIAEKKCAKNEKNEMGVKPNSRTEMQNLKMITNKSKKYYDSDSGGLKEASARKERACMNWNS